MAESTSSTMGSRVSWVRNLYSRTAMLYWTLVWVETMQDLPRKLRCHLGGARRTAQSVLWMLSRLDRGTIRRCRRRCDALASGIPVVQVEYSRGQQSNGHGGVQGVGEEGDKAVRFISTGASVAWADAESSREEGHEEQEREDFHPHPPVVEALGVVRRQLAGPAEVDEGQDQEASQRHYDQLGDGQPVHVPRVAGRGHHGDHGGSSHHHGFRRCCRRDCCRRRCPRPGPVGAEQRRQAEEEEDATEEVALDPVRLAAPTFLLVIGVGWGGGGGGGVGVFGRVRWLGRRSCSCVRGPPRQGGAEHRARLVDQEAQRPRNSSP